MEKNKDTITPPGLVSLGHQYRAKPQSFWWPGLSQKPQPEVMIVGPSLLRELKSDWYHVVVVAVKGSFL